MSGPTWMRPPFPCGNHHDCTRSCAFTPVAQIVTADGNV